MTLTTQFACPSCGYAYTKAKTTSNASRTGETRRRRVCLKCEVGFITYEITAADFAIMQSMRDWLKAQSKIADTTVIG